jgi:hypothetical protein
MTPGLCTRGIKCRCKKKLYSAKIDSSRPEVAAKSKPQLLIGSLSPVEPNPKKAMTFKVSSRPAGLQQHYAWQQQNSHTAPSSAKSCIYQLARALTFLLRYVNLPSSCLTTAQNTLKPPNTFSGTYKARADEVSPMATPPTPSQSFAPLLIPIGQCPRDENQSLGSSLNVGMVL